MSAKLDPALWLSTPVGPRLPIQPWFAPVTCAPVKYPVLFTAGGLSVGGLAIGFGGWHLLLLWPAVNLLALAAIYGMGRPDWLGKTREGRMTPAVVLAMAPYFVFTWIVWHIFRAVTPESAADQVAENIWVGRRPLGPELPAGTALIVDLTAEFPVNTTVRSHHEVVCVPTLDAKAPADGLMPGLISRIQRTRGPIYIHCAAGHGRAATVAAAVIMDRGLARTAEEAEAYMRKARPGISLHRAQKALLARLYPSASS